MSDGTEGGAAAADEDGMPRYVAPPTRARDSRITINNEGLWQSYGVVSDMNGNQIAGLAGYYCERLDEAWNCLYHVTGPYASDS